MQLRGDAGRFRKAGVRVVLVGLGTPERAAWFCQEKRLPFVCTTGGEDAAAHRAFGLNRGSLRQIFTAEAGAKWAALQLDPETRQRMPYREDWRMLPGVFVIDRVGIVRYAHRNRQVADNPSNDEVLAAVAAL